MKYPNPQQVKHLIVHPDYYAEQMSVPNMDKVISAFVRERQYKVHKQ